MAVEDREAAAAAVQVVEARVAVEGMAMAVVVTAGVVTALAVGVAAGMAGAVAAGMAAVAAAARAAVARAVAARVEESLEADWVVEKVAMVGLAVVTLESRRGSTCLRAVR
jgi:hypothetical protein